MAKKKKVSCGEYWVKRERNEELKDEKLMSHYLYAWL